MPEERVLSDGGFRLVVTPSNLRLSRNGQGSIEITPAEVAELTQFLSVAKSLASKKVLPPHITATPFRIFFGEGKEDTSLTLFKRGGERANMVPFDFQGIDILILLLNKGVASWKDAQTLGNNPRAASTPAFSTPEPTFEGMV